MRQEREQPSSQFRKNMLAAFRHGRDFEPSQSNDDFNPDETEGIHLPFSEWFVKHYQDGGEGMQGKTKKQDGYRFFGYVLTTVIGLMSWAIVFSTGLRIAYGKFEKPFGAACVLVLFLLIGMFIALTTWMNIPQSTEEDA